MRFLYLLLFHAIFNFTTAIAAIICFFVSFLSKKILVKTIHKGCNSLLWLLKVMVGVDYEIQGIENIPQEPCLFASKHQSMWETLMLYRFLPNSVPIAKRELFLIPFFGWAMQRADLIFLDRGDSTKALRSLIKKSQDRIQRKISIIIFPEGTRRPVGAPPDYKIGVAALYKYLDVPCVPIALNSGKFLPRRSFERYRGTIQVRILPPIPAGLKREEFMPTLQEAIETEMKKIT